MKKIALSEKSTTIKDGKRWQALMKSGRIRFFGSGSIGKEKGQVLCVEFHSDVIDASEQDKRQLKLSKNQLTLYADAIIKNSK